MSTTRAAPPAPSHPPCGASSPYAAHASLAAHADDDNQPMDVDLSVTKPAAANAINIQLRKLTTSPLSSDVPHDDIIRNHQELTTTDRFLSSILDEKLDEKTWNPHQEGFIFR
jgi:hypothetical protein